jgi:hypothetical protein
MRCDDFEARLNDLIDRGLSWEADDELTVHAAACSECREVRDAYRMLLEGTAALERPLLSESMGPRVLLALKQTPELQLPPAIAATWTRYVPTASWLAALAAGIVLAVVLRPWLTGEPGAAPGNQPTVAKVEPTQPQERAVVDSQVVESTSVESPVVVENAVATATPMNEDAKNGSPFVSGLLDEVADGLSPLRQSTSGALDELLDSLVLVDASATPK